MVLDHQTHSFNLQVNHFSTMGRDQVQKKKGQGSGGVRKTTALEAKTKKGKRYLEQKAPQVVEYVKRLLLLYGHKTSQTVKDVMVELKHLRDRAECRHLTRKNDNILPFENGGETSLEFLCNKQDCGAFVVGSSTKKRPNNLIFGRVYDEKGTPTYPDDISCGWMDFRDKREREKKRERT